MEIAFNQLKDQQAGLNMKIMEQDRRLREKDTEIEKLKWELDEWKRQQAAEKEIITEYINAENYLKELIDEFKNGMKRIYEDDIQFKNLDEEELTFCERFSNLLYNILLIIDH